MKAEVINPLFSSIALHPFFIALEKSEKDIFLKWGLEYMELKHSNSTKKEKCVTTIQRTVENSQRIVENPTNSVENGTVTVENAVNKHKNIQRTIEKNRSKVSTSLIIGQKNQERLMSILKEGRLLTELKLHL
jgi:ketol-acid reductoisomerase